MFPIPQFFPAFLLRFSSSSRYGYLALVVKADVQVARNSFWKLLEMFEEGEKSEEPPKSENVGENEGSSKERKKFKVDRVKFDVEPATDQTSSPSPISPETFTFGYATNEAIPMTVFYRTQHSQDHSGKHRPTLQELRKGLEGDNSV